MLRIALSAVLILASATAASATEQITIVGRGEKTPPATLRVNPVIPRAASEHGKEGWVHVRLAVSAAGEVGDVQIVESYPMGVFDQAVLKSVSSWKFTPRLEDGVAVADPAYDIGIAFYNDAYETNRNTTAPYERGGRVRGINAANLATFRKAGAALDAGDTSAAGAALDALTKRFEAGDLSVTDIARYFADETRYNRLRDRYDTTLSWARRALMLAQFLDNGKVVYGLHLEMVESLVAMGREAEAIDYYDSWRKVEKQPIPEALVQQMDSVRRRTGGAGHVYTIVDFDETHEREHRNASQDKALIHPAHGPEESTVNLQSEARHVYLDLPRAQVVRGPE